MSPEGESNSGATETSPLLPRAAVQVATQRDGIGPLGVLDGEALERQTKASSVNLPTEQEGLPEVRKRLPFIFPAIAFGVLLCAADQTIIVSSYGKIGSELDALNRTSWIATAYFLTLTSIQPLYGKLSDIFGRKACLLFGYCVFGLGCLGCGLAQNIEQLIGARAFAGIGGGAMTTVVSILLSDICTLRERGKWQGYVNIMWALGSSAGAPLGGIAADYIGWRWAFLVQAPMCALAFIGVALTLHLPKRESFSWMTDLKRIDLPGALTLIGAVFMLLLGLDRGSNVSWTATVAYVSVAVSIPLFGIFVLVEKYVAAEPFAPGHVIFNRAMLPCYLCNFFMSGWLAAMFYIPLYFQAVDHVSATKAGLRIIPSVVLGVLGSLFAGFYMQRTGKYYWLTVVSYTGLVCGVTVIFLCSGVAVSSTVGIILGMCICAFSNGNGITSTLIGLIAQAEPGEQAVVTACTYLFRSLGGVFSIAVSATVANSALRTSLASELPALGLSKSDAIEIAEKVRQSLSNLFDLDPHVRAVVETCFAQSTASAFGLQIALVSGTAISAWFIREKGLSR